MKDFKINPNLRIGNVIEVSGTAIKVSLDRTQNELVQTFNGTVYHIGKVGSLIKLHTGPIVLIATVKNLLLSSESTPVTSTDSTIIGERLIEAELIGEARYQTFKEEKKDNLKFVRGVSNYPLPHQGVFLVTKTEEYSIYSAIVGGDKSDLIEIGTYAYSSNVSCRVNMNKLFGHHFAVLGSTGTGKSTAVSGIIHSVLEQTLSEEERLKKQTEDLKIKIENPDNQEVNSKSVSQRVSKPIISGIYPRIILIDPNGEYLSTFGKHATVFYLVDSNRNPNKFKPLRLPYWLMSSEEFQDFLFGNSNLSTNSNVQIIDKALKHARMHHLGMVSKAKAKIRTKYRSKSPDRIIKTQSTSQNEIDCFNLDLPIPFDINELTDHIRFCQNYKFTNGEWNALPDSEFQLKYAPLLDKLAALQNDSKLSFLMQKYDKKNVNLEEILAQFVGSIDANDEKPIRIIDTSGLSNELASLLNVVLARLIYLFKYSQAPENRKNDPILLVYEEAHRYFNNRNQTQNSNIQDEIRKIAREGRKYGIGLALISHKPSDLDSVVLSQCSTWLVMRLTNGNDQDQVAKFLPDSMSGLSKILSSLPRQEALLVGEAAPLPSRVKLNFVPEEKRPVSSDVSFSKGWGEKLSSNSELKNITKKMMGI